MEKFLHHLHDTVVLLGGRKDVAEMLLTPSLLDEPAAVDILRQYNIDLSESLKDRLVSLNKMEIQVVTDASSDG